MKSLTGVKAGPIIKSKLKKALCLLFSAVLAWSCFDVTSFAFADDGSQSTSVKVNDYLTATLSSDRASYTAGDTATFTITVENAGKDDYGKETVVQNIAFADSALNDAVKDQLGNISFGDVKSKDGPVSQTFQVKIPKDLLSMSTILGMTVSTKKNGSADLSLPVFVNSYYQGVVLKSGVDAGSQLSGYSATYDEDILKATFGLLNYNVDTTGYDYALSVVASEISGGASVDITDKLTAQWEDSLPGDTGQGVSGSGNLAGSTAGAGTVSFAFDPSGELAVYSEYKVTLTVTDADGNQSSETVTMHRERMDLDSVTWSFRDDTANSGVITKTGTAWFSTLYYDNVAADPRVPFSDATSLKAYLASLPSVADAQAALEKYIWDMYEPHKGVAGDYGDSSLGWPKDGITPFHHQLTAKIEQMGTYSQAEAGVAYTDEYFQNLKKTAGPDEGDNNTDRDYTIELQADTNPVATNPAVYVLMIPTHWQTFDELHATAQKGASGQTAGGSILTSVDEMANLYDVKYAIIRFANYLKEKGSNAAVAIVNTQHGSDNSMVISGGYYTTNMDDLIYGVEGWDSFGDCEHVHWTCKSMKGAIDNIKTNLSGWTDADGVPVDLNNVTKTVVAIGGTNENATGTDGYQACLDGSTDWNASYDASKKKEDSNWANVDFLYGIRTITGTTQVYQGSRPIYSWLDNYHNQEMMKAYNKYYTSIDDPDNPAYSICTSEDAVYEKLVSIYEQSGTVQGTNKYGIIDNATLSDTVTDEFDVKSVTATWTSCDGSSTTSTWTVDGGTVVDPSDPSADQISVNVNADGSTDVSVNFGTLVGTGNIDVKIDAVAKQDYMGSNNVKTNVGTPQVNWSHTFSTSQETKSFTANFAEDPSVNVPVLNMEATGGSDSGRVGTAFDLKDYAKFDSGELLNGKYDQLNGTLKLSWVEVAADGTETEVADDSSYAPMTYTVVDGAIQGTLELPSCTVKSDAVGTRNFKLKVSYEPEDATNGMVPVTGKSVDANVDLTWTDKMALSVLKVDADDKEPLAGVGFELRLDNGDDVYDPDTDALAEVYSNAACTEKITGPVLTTDSGKAHFYGMRPGIYWLKESSTIAGYRINGDAVRLRVEADGTVFVTGASGAEAPATVKNDVAYITIQNEKIPEIPSAGSSGRPLMQLLSVVAFALAALLGARRLRDTVLPL